MSRKESRNLAFKLIFSVQIQKEDNEKQLKNFIENNELDDEETIKYVTNTFNGVIEKNDVICDAISKNLKKDWSIDRLSKVDISILKLAVYEMMFAQIPFKVAINEAVELAKEYGDDNSPSFVNGVLAGVLKVIENN